MSQRKQVSLDSVLFTDFYQLSMAQVYFEKKIHQKEVQFDYFFRNYPDYGLHQAGYCIFCGLEPLVGWIKKAAFQSQDIDRLRQAKKPDKTPFFSDNFIDWLASCGNFKNINLSAVPEARVVHPEVPLLSVRGPLAMAQVLETRLLNYLNYQTLIATKACRIKEAGKGNLLLEFGLRRAQGKGADLGTRAALIGGADFSSNAATSYNLGLLPKGTHSHSMIQAFIALGYSELDSFRAYASIYPDACIFLVDTINTLNSGLPNAIKVFKELAKKGHQPLGVRLDSGDLAYLSIQAAKMLDAAGLKKVKIVLSNKLDEMVIWQIITQIQQEASKYGVDPSSLIKRLVYGVGTNLITSQGSPALDGVYKLAAVFEKNQAKPSFKLSETPAKISNPGIKTAWRLYDKRKKAVADLLARSGEKVLGKKEIVLHHLTQEKQRVISRKDIFKSENLQTEIISKGKVVYDFPSIQELRQTRKKDLTFLDSGVKRLINPHRYHVSLSQELWQLKKKMIEKAS